MDTSEMQDQPRRRARPPLLPMALAIAAVLAFTAAYAAWMALPARPAFHGTTFDAVSPAADFRLADPDGRAVTLAGLRGRPVLVFFGYTRCPDVCPLTLDRLTRTLRELGDDETRVLFVTVDPEHDTPDVLRRFVARFGGRVTPLTGDSAALARAWQGYSVYAERNPQPSPSADHHAMPGMAMYEHREAPAVFTHSGAVYGIDRRGNLRVLISDGETDDERRDDVVALSRI
jgi:protein SCO1/2